MLNDSRVAFNAFWWDGLDSPGKVQRVCAGLADLGYKGVEWKETCFGQGQEAWSRLAMAARATKDAGLEVTDFVILRNLVDPDPSAPAVEEICEFVRAAGGAGVSIVNLGSGPTLSRQLPPDEWWKPASPDWARSWDALERSLGKIVKAAEQAGVVIAFEATVGALVHDYYSTLEMLRRLPSPALGLTLDPSHYLIHDNDIGYAIRTLKDKIRHVHVKDAVGHPGAFGRDFLFPILGEGAIDWQEFFAALTDIGYGGWLSLEFESFKYMAEVLHGDVLQAASLSMRSFQGIVSGFSPKV